MKPLASTLTSKSNERGNQKAHHADFQAQTKSMPTLIPGPVERHPLTAFNPHSKEAKRKIASCTGSRTSRKAQHVTPRPQSKGTTYYFQAPIQGHAYAGASPQLKEAKKCRIEGSSASIEIPSLFFFLFYFCSYIFMQFNMVVIV